MTTRRSAPERRRSPWVVAIVVGLVIMVLVNIVFLYVAVRGADQVAPSYHLEQR